MKSPYKHKMEIRNLIHKIKYSFNGLGTAFKNEGSFRIEVLLAFILIPLSFYASQSKIELLLMLSAILIVLIVELVNSAIELTLDRISLSKNNLTKRAKDIGSAAVFLSLGNLITTWLIIIFY